MANYFGNLMSIVLRHFFLEFLSGPRNYTIFKNEIILFLMLNSTYYNI